MDDPPEPPPPAGSPRGRTSDDNWQALARLPVPAGLCARCAHLELLSSPRSVFVRCGLAATDARFPRYPALPVTACAGYRPAD